MKRILIVLLLVAGLSLSAEAEAAYRAHLTWDANTEADLAGYKVYFGTASGKYGAPIDAGKTATPSAPSFNVDLLQDGTYYFAVTAYDTAGNESGYSVEVVKVVDTTAPKTPTGLKVLLEKILAALRQLFGQG